MPEYKPQKFIYAHSHAIMKGIEAYLSNSKGIVVGADYEFVEKPGGREAFEDMVALAGENAKDWDTLYVESVKEFAGGSLADFKAALTAMQQAKLKVVSMVEGERYNYDSFMTAIEILEELMPEYEKDRRKLEALIMAEHDMEYGDILQYTGLSKADVFQVLADRAREQEKAEE